ncbi:MAG: YjjG family noncanonical pyrimidine nucleotidase [Bacteroidota bacterium]
MNTRYQWLFFDLDRTLLDFDRSADIALEKAMLSKGMAYKAVYLSQYKKINKACWLAYEQGRISSEELAGLRFDLFFKELGIQADPFAFNTHYLDQLAANGFLIEGCQSLLSELDKHFRMLIITNGLQAVQGRRIQQMGLTHYFEKIIISQEIKVAKPYPGFFEEAFRNADQPSKSDVLVIGDSLNTDIKGGNDFGLDTCWFNPTQTDHPEQIQPTYQVHSLKQLEDQLLKTVAFD